MPGTLSFAYGTPSAPPPFKDLPAALKAIQGVLDTYNAAQGGEMFRVIQDGEHFHVVPVRVRETDGQLAEVTSLFDRPISIAALSDPDPSRNTAVYLLQNICRALVGFDNDNVTMGMIPNQMFSLHQTQLAASDESARSVLDKLFQEMNAPLSWQLFYDPEIKWCAVNVHEVRLPDKSAGD